MSAARTGLLTLLVILFASAVADAQDPHSGHGPPAQQKPTPPQDDHAAHAGDETGEPKEPVPSLTDADRAAAFPPGLEGHATHDRRISTFVLFDQLEWQSSDKGAVFLDNTSWLGGDLHRVWLRADGESSAGRVEHAHVHVLYGRSISRWWDVVIGARQDFRPGPSQAWLAFGIQGLAPQWFEVEATGYVGQGGRTHLRLEVEYELLLTTRLVLQPLLEAEIYGKDDPERGIGAGLSALDGGLRLRYEIRRELAPYVGIVWHRPLFGTADYARAEGDEIGRPRVVAGLRVWF